MIVSGVWACWYREMQPISFATPASKKTARGDAQPLMGGGDSHEMGEVRGEEIV